MEGELGREGLVNFPEVDIGIGQPAASKQSRHCKGRRHQQALLAEIDGRDLIVDESGLWRARRQPGHPGIRSHPDRGRAIGQWRGIARRQRPVAGCPVKGRPEPGQPLE